MSILPDTPYFDSLIDDFGIWQHTDETKILRAEGYSLDDAARGLIAALAYKKTEKAAVLLNYLLASKASEGKFYGFSKANRKFIKNIASDDATGQVIWAAGYCYKLNFKKNQAEDLIKYTLNYALSFEHFRGLAYTLLGIINYDKNLSKLVYDKLMLFFKDVTDDWPWPEDELTYGNGIIPYVLIKYGLAFNDKKAIKFGKKILVFLEQICQKNRLLGPVGNEGWYKKGGTKVPDYSQQPIDTAYMIFAWISDYKASHLGSSLDAAEKWFSWFEGNNILGQKMYNETDMRCYDGIDAAGVHKHSGAESNICFLMSIYAIETKKVF